MGRNATRLTAWGVTSIALLSSLILLLVPSIASAEPAERVVVEHLDRADTFYEIGIEEHGNMAAFRAGMRELDAARNVLEKSPPQTHGKAGTLRAIEALRLDISAQADIAHDTFMGVFPVANLLTPSLFVDCGAGGSFELLDDPAVVASTSAAEQLAESMMQVVQRNVGQAQVIVLSSPPDRGLENEIRYVFSTRLYARPQSEADEVKALASSQRASLRKSRDLAELSSTLAAPLNTGGVLIVLVKRANLVAGEIHHYRVAGRLYRDGEAVGREVIQNGFCRDRRHQLRPILAFHLLLLLIAFVGYHLLSKPGEVSVEAHGADRWKETLLVAGGGFLWGRTIPWALIALLDPIKPEAESLIYYAFWWPLVAGVFVLLAPVLLFHVAARKLGLKLEANRLRLAFPAIALGTAAYLAVPLVLLSEAAGWISVAPLTLGVVAIARMMGVGLERLNLGSTSVALGIALVCAAAIGASAATSVHWLVWIAAAFSVAAAVLFERRSMAQTTETVAEDDEDAVDGSRAVEDSDLRGRINRPSFTETVGVFDEAWRRLGAFRDSGMAEWMAVTGTRGAGKTATALEIIKRLDLEGSFTLVKLVGSCPVLSKDENADDGVPYAPFKEALAHHFQVNLFNPPQSELTRINTALEQAFETSIPFSGLLFPPGEDDFGERVTRGELFYSVVRMLRHLARDDRRVVLLIDDAHWMDSGSLELLKAIHEHIPPGSDVPLLVMWTARKGPDQLAALLGEDLPPFELEALSRDEQTRFLSSALALEEEAAERVVRALQVGKLEPPTPMWLLEVVRHLEEQAVFSRKGDRFGLAESYEDEQRGLPMPTQLVAAISARVRQFPEYRNVFDAAACLGKEFHATVLAGSLEMRRLDVLHLLMRIEEDTGLINDVLELDDTFAFVSPLVLEVVRGSMRISGRGPKATDVPQIVREYHARAAMVLRKKLDEGAPAVAHEVFQHSYAAGASSAAQAVEFGLLSAHAARKVFHFASARQCLEMVKECTDVAGVDVDIDEELLLVDLYEAHARGTRGENARDLAKRGREHLKWRGGVASHRCISAVARACYENREFANAIELGKQMVANAKTKIEAAEGHHWIGLSLDLPRHDDDADVVRAKRAARMSHLEKARDLAEATESDSDSVRSLLARVYNSIAEELSYISDRRTDAPEYFEKSIALKTELGDLPGLARSHGGLGRFYFYAKTPNHEKAAVQFDKDLEIAKKLDDRNGQCQMHSLLGGCAFKQQHHEEALNHYLASWELAEGWLNRFFAGVGVLEVASATNDAEHVDAKGNALLVESTRETKDAKPQGVPRVCAARLVSVLEKNGESWRGEWTKDLLEGAKRALG